MPSNISRAELIRKFRALGFKGPFAGKKHQFMIKGTQKIRIPNPHGSILPPNSYTLFVLGLG